MSDLSNIQLGALRAAARSGVLVPLKGGFWVSADHAAGKYVEVGARGSIHGGTFEIVPVTLASGAVVTRSGLYAQSGEHIEAATKTNALTTPLVYWGTNTINALLNRGLIQPAGGRAWGYPYPRVELTQAGRDALGSVDP